jgi:hypothetical protein
MSHVQDNMSWIGAQQFDLDSKFNASSTAFIAFTASV